MVEKVSGPLKEHAGSKSQTLFKDKIVAAILKSLEDSLKAGLKGEISLTNPVGSYMNLQKLNQELSQKLAITNMIVTGALKGTIAVINNLQDINVLNGLLDGHSKEDITKAIPQEVGKEQVEKFQKVSDMIVDGISKGLKGMGAEINIARHEEALAAKLDEDVAKNSEFFISKFIAVQSGLSVKEIIDSFILIIMSEELAVGLAERQTSQSVDDISSFTGRAIEGKGRRKKRILICEDIQKIRTVTKIMLEQAGFEVIEASNGAEGLSKLKKEDNISLALLDVMMPEMDGFQLCEEMTKNERLKEIPVIFLTALDKHDDIIRAGKLGVKGYIVKPFTKQGLVSKVKSVIEESINK